MKTFSLFILSLLISTDCLSGVNQNIQITRYKQSRACAISYTLDDGLAEHYTLPVPRPEEKGFQETFWVCDSNINKNNENITDTIRVTRPQLKETADGGHEISSYDWVHKSFTHPPIEEIKEDIFRNDSAVFTNTGVIPHIFRCPNNNKKAEGRRIAIRDRVGIRAHQHLVGSRSTLEDLEERVDILTETNNWGVGMTHGLTYDYDAFRNPQCLWDHLDQIKTREDEIWAGTFHKVAPYTKERGEAEPEVANRESTLLIAPEFKLDQELFVKPSTMVITGKEIKKVTVEQGKRRLPVQITDGKVLFNFDPYGGIIKVVLRIWR